MEAAHRKEARLPSGEPRVGCGSRWKGSRSWWQCTFMCKVGSSEDCDPALKAAVGRWLCSKLLLLPPHYHPEHLTAARSQDSATLPSASILFNRQKLAW